MNVNGTPWNPDQAAERIRQAFNRLADNDATLNHVFTQRFEALIDHRLKALATGGNGPLCGALVTIKDLFDVAGYVTRAGTRFMADNAPARSHAESVQRLLDAGAIALGHTNMTELAYSGLGLNPHYGTASSVLYPGHVAGGSTSGGAVSVASGIADIALGTDTGGSLRIPAAFNGVVGFKPTQSQVSRRGCQPLSQSLDSVGPIADSVSVCRLAFNVLRRTTGETPRLLQPHFMVPDNHGMDDLDAGVAAAFSAAVERLQSTGMQVETGSLQSLEQLKALPIWQFSAVECRASHDDAYRQRLPLIDPRVSSRMARADDVSAVEYRQTLNQRERLITQFQQELQDRVLLMPTVPILPPTLSELSDDQAYARINLQVLRNPSIANVMDGCSISLPLRHDGITVGIMLTAVGLADQSLLDLAATCETVFAD